MADAEYPGIIRQLPEADVPFKGVRGWILQGLNHQAVFMDIEPIGDVLSLDLDIDLDDVKLMKQSGHKNHEFKERILTQLRNG